MGGGSFGLRPIGYTITSGFLPLVDIELLGRLSRSLDRAARSQPLFA
jgi:hypothetical protein